MTLEEIRIVLLEAGMKVSQTIATQIREWGVPKDVAIDDVPAEERAQVILAHQTERVRAIFDGVQTC